MNLHNLNDILRYRAENEPEKIAFTFLEDGEREKDCLTYKDLDRQARAIAGLLQSKVIPGERALLLYPTGLDFISAFFGCLYAGVVAVPAYPPSRKQRRNRLQTIASDAEPKIILTTTAVRETVEQCFANTSEYEQIKIIITDEIENYWAEKCQKIDFDSDSLAFLQYTSGSTSKPKGVMVSHGNLMYNEEMIKTAFGHSASTVFVGWLPLFHDMGLIGNVLQPLYLGIPCYLMSPVAFLQQPLRWLKAISRYQATTSGGPNFAYKLCLDKISPETLEGLDLSSWRVAFNGAEPIQAAIQEQFTNTFAPYGFAKEAFYPCYGLAETTLFVSGGLSTSPAVVEQFQDTALQENRVKIANNSSETIRSLVSCGRSWLEQDIAIADPESLTVCPPEKIGEIWVSGKNVAQGYWNKSETTKSTFFATLDNYENRHFLRTGDLGFLHDGELFVTGRLKDVIIIRGRNHYPQDIELTVEKSHPAIRTNCCAAFSLDIDGEERLVIVAEVERNYLRDYLRSTDTDAGSFDKVIKAIRQAVSEYHELQVYSISLLKTATIPKTSSGKIQRHVCKSDFLAKSLSVVHNWTEMPEVVPEQLILKEDHAITEKPQDEDAIAAWLIKNLARHLRIDPDEIDPEEPIAQYGLDSSVAVTLTDELANWLGHDFDPTLFWEYPTVAELVEYLAQLELTK
ncbi:MAG: AMP-binding protein [Cyanobacteria bacterium P01_F01_bin.143]